MTTFSFRAECQHDVDKLLNQFCHSGLITSINTKQVDQFSDVIVEFEVSANLETIRGLMRNVIDGHVMLQTLRECLLSKNSLERDFDLH